MTSRMPSLPSDEEIVRRIRESREAFSLLVERYHRMVFAIALARVRDRDIAEEIMQETFLRAWLHLDQLRRPEQLGAWLGSIARNITENWRLTHQTRSRLAAMVPLDCEIETIADHRTDGPRAELMSREEERLVHEALDKLPPPAREVVFLHFLEGLTQSDIARRFGVYPSTVGRQLEKALGLLRRELGALLQPESVRGVAEPSRRSVGKATLLLAALAALPEAARAQIRDASLQGSGPAGTSSVAPVSGSRVPHFSLSGDWMMPVIKVSAAASMIVAGIVGGVHLNSGAGTTPAGHVGSGGTGGTSSGRWQANSVSATLPSVPALGSGKPAN